MKEVVLEGAKRSALCFPLGQVLTGPPIRQGTVGRGYEVLKSASNRLQEVLREAHSLGVEGQHATEC